MATLKLAFQERVAPTLRSVWGRTIALAPAWLGRFTTLAAPTAPLALPAMTKNFMDLPYEQRSKIWKYAFSTPGIVTVLFRNTHLEFLKYDFPPGLTICKECRSVVLKTHTSLRLDASPVSPGFDDFVLAAGNIFYLTFNEPRQPTKGVVPRGPIQIVAMDRWITAQRISEDSGSLQVQAYITFLQEFHNLKTVILVEALSSISSLKLYSEKEFDATLLRLKALNPIPKLGEVDFRFMVEQSGEDAIQVPWSEIF